MGLLQLKWDFCNLIHDPSHYKTSIEHHRGNLFYIFARELGSHYATEEVFTASCPLPIMSYMYISFAKLRCKSPIFPYMKYYQADKSDHGT